jgi:DNA-binding transcriptional LysR family regulator
MADRRLRVFYTVARLLSFTRAAETLHMTQPAVTFQIRQLESYFDTRLFNRAHNRVTLTAAGRKMYEYAERIFALYSEMEHALKELKREVSGALTLGASSTVAECLLSALLCDFKRAHPEVDLRLKIADADDIVAMVENGAIDVGVVEGAATGKKLRIDLCHIDQMVVIAPQGHPLTGQDRISMQTVARYPLISWEAGSSMCKIIMNYLAAGGLDLNGLNSSLQLGSIESIKGAVQAGLGVGIIPRAAVKEFDSLICIHLDPPLQQSFFFVRPPCGARAADELLDFVRGCNNT